MIKYAAVALVLLGSLTSSARAGGKSGTDENAFQCLYFAWLYSTSAEQAGAGTAAAASLAYTDLYTFYALLASYYSVVADEVGTEQADDEAIAYADLCLALINLAYANLANAYVQSTNPVVLNSLYANYIWLYNAQLYMSERALGR